MSWSTPALGTGNRLLLSMQLSQEFSFWQEIIQKPAMHKTKR
jgi:hypothetical protein